MIRTGSAFWSAPIVSQQNLDQGRPGHWRWPVRGPWSRWRMPGAIRGASDEVLRTAGLSAGKVRSLRDLAEKVHIGEVPLAAFPDLPDEEVIAPLLPVRGIGRWTAEMFLIFSLGGWMCCRSPTMGCALPSSVSTSWRICRRSRPCASWPTLETLPERRPLVFLAEPGVRAAKQLCRVKAGWKEWSAPLRSRLGRSKLPLGRLGLGGHNG